MARLRLVSLTALIVMLSALAVPAGGAEFDIDSGQTVLRRLQLCQDCGSALLVTRVHPGVMVRCPDCGREQARLREQYLITQIYQLCRLCQASLDPEGHRPGETVECSNCHTKQTMTRDAFLADAQKGGPGYAPGFPPGTGPKRLLFDSGADNSLAGAGVSIAPDVPPGLPDRDGPAPVAPLDSLLPDTVLPPSPFMPEPAIPAPPPEFAAAPAAPTPAPQPAAKPADDVLEVPSVSVDMFGGKRRTAAPTAVGADTSAVLARVNGRPIRAESVDAVAGPALRALAASTRDPAERAAREKELRTKVLDQLIDRELAAEEAERLGFKPDPAEVRQKAAELAPRLAGTSLDPQREAKLEIALAAMRREAGGKPEAVGPEALRALYQARKNDLLQPRRVAVSTLTVFRDRVNRADPRDYRALAQEISGQLEQGARFDDLRARYDEFPPLDNAPPPLMPEAHYAEEVRATLQNLPAGAVFGPLFLPGLALFGKVTESREPEPLPFAEVEKDLRAQLAQSEADKEFASWLEKLRRQAVVTFGQ